MFMQLEQLQKAVEIVVADLPDWNISEYCQNCCQLCSNGTKCYNYYPDKVSVHNNK